MSTLVLGDPPQEIMDLIERRRALGLDLYDEVWEGDYHMAPAPHRAHGELDFELAHLLYPRAKRAGLRGSGPCNIGRPDDYRVPDQAYFAASQALTFNPTAEIVVEIVSPGDETRQKFGFYFRAGVKEMLIVDPSARTVEWYIRGESGLDAVDGSRLLGVASAELFDLIDWP